MNRPKSEVFHAFANSRVEFLKTATAQCLRVNYNVISIVPGSTANNSVYFT